MMELGNHGCHREEDTTFQLHHRFMQDVASDHRVTFHHLEFFGREAPRFEENRIRDAYLANIVLWPA